MKPVERVKVFPPREVLQNPEGALWDSDDARILDGTRMEFPPEGGMRYYATSNSVPYNGFPYSVATADLAIFKRYLILKLKNPLSWYGIRQEAYEMAYTAIRRHFLVPKYYSRSGRELFRVASLHVMSVDDFWAHVIASVVEWDVAYRFRVQAVAGFINQARFKKFPIFEALKVIGYAKNMDGNENVKKTWKALRMVLVIGSIVRPRLTRRILRELNVSELLMDEADKYWAFPTQRK